MKPAKGSGTCATLELVSWYSRHNLNKRRSYLGAAAEIVVQMFQWTHASLSCIYCNFMLDSYISYVWFVLSWGLHTLSLVIVCKSAFGLPPWPWSRCVHWNLRICVPYQRCRFMFADLCTVVPLLIVFELHPQPLQPDICRVGLLRTRYTWRLHWPSWQAHP